VNLQQNLQQFGAFRLLLRYCRDSATIISHLLTIINGLLTNTYKTPWRTENPCVGGSIPPLPTFDKSWVFNQLWVVSFHSQCSEKSCLVLRYYPMSKTDLQNQVSLSFDRGTLLLTGLTRKELSDTSGSCVWRWDTRVGAWRCDAIYYTSIFRALVERFGADFSDEVMKPAAASWPKVELPKLRPEQTEALAAWSQAGCCGQIIMPTGTGKTEVALAAMARTKTATLVVAPVRDLMYQWHRRILRAFDYDSGIVGDGLSNIKPITVTTYDSAYIHMAKMGAGFGLLIFDEEHHLPGKCRREAAILSTAKMRLGLTATPQRSDGLHKDLDWLIGPVVYDMPFKKAKGSTLADFDVVRIPVALKTREQAAYDRCRR